MNVEAGKRENAASIPKPAGILGVRHTQYALLTAATVIAYGIRTVLNVAVIAMISDDPPDDNVPTVPLTTTSFAVVCIRLAAWPLSLVCSMTYGILMRTNKFKTGLCLTYPEWASKKNIMLSSFFWGYVCFQIGAGQLAEKYGPKLFLGSAVFICSIFTALIPLFGAKFGYGGVIACRIIQGLCQGFLFPSTHNLLSAWAPIQDRATMGSLVYTGGPLGNVLAMPITGMLSASSVGWPGAFYLYGALGIIWSILWIIFGSDSPSKHKTISPEEKKYIEAGLPAEEREMVPTPWISIFTSLPFLAILVSHCGQNWGFWTLLTEIPSYMEKILEFKIASNSYLSALPYFVLWLLSFVMSPIADLLVAKKIVNLGNSRKIFNTIGLFIPALALISLTFVGSTEKEVTIVILVIAVGFNAGTYSGFNVNHIDISPVHSGTLMGITNSMSNVFSILAPLAVDAIKSVTGREETDKDLWNIVFCIAAGIYLVTGSFYIFAASGKVQPWDRPETRNQKEQKIEKIPR